MVISTTSCGTHLCYIAWAT